MFSEPLTFTISAFTLNLIAYVFIFLIIISGIRFDFKNTDYKYFKWYGFGLIYATPETRINKNLNLIRKTQNKNLFINAPRWFNVYVKNIGGSKSNKI